MNLQVGQPLSFYNRGQEDWPELWRLPEQDGDADLFSKVAHLTDDLVLRAALNVFDNCLRAPQAFGGVSGGVLSAHARLFVGASRNTDDLEKAADVVREAWLGQAREWAAVKREGWRA